MMKNTWYCKGFAFFLHLTLGLMMLDWACPLPAFFGFVGIYECSFLVTFLFFTVCLCFEGKTVFPRLRQTIKQSPFLVSLVLLYTSWGFICALRGPDVGFGLIRYRVTGQMLLFCPMLMTYLVAGNYKKRLKLLAANLSVSSCVISVIAIAGYFSDLYTAYFQRISPIKDYNQYATLLLMGLASGIMLCYKVKRPLWQKCICLIPFATLLSVAIYMAGSRRSDVLLCVLGCVYFVYGLYLICRHYHFKPNKKHLLLCVCGLLAASVCAVSASAGVHTLTEDVCKHRIAVVEKLKSDKTKSLDEKTKQRLDLLSDPDNLGDTITDITTGVGFSRRSIIWKIAVEEIKSSTPSQLILGRGASYSWDLYDDHSNAAVEALRSKYPYMTDDLSHWMNPHNLFLQDVLEGGLIQLVLLLAVMITIGLGVLRLLHRASYSGICIFLMYCILFVTFILSSAKGVCAHKYFWLLLAWQVCAISQLPNKKKGIDI